MEAVEWVNLSDDELLEKKISHLGLKLEGSEIQLESGEGINHARLG